MEGKKKQADDVCVHICEGFQNHFDLKSLVPAAGFELSKHTSVMKQKHTLYKLMSGFSLNLHVQSCWVLLATDPVATG